MDGMRRNLALLILLAIIVAYIQYTFKDQDVADQLIPNQVSSLELKSVHVLFNQEISYFSDDLMPVDSNKMLQLLTYLKNLKVVAREKLSTYSGDDLEAMFEVGISFKINNITYSIGSLQLASGRIPVRRSDNSTEVLWVVDDNSVLAQYESESDAFNKRYNQLKGILSNNKFSLFQANVLQHWDMLIWKSLIYVSKDYSTELNILENHQSNPSLSIDKDVLELWFAALSELKAIAYLKHNNILTDPLFKLSFASERGNKWIEGHVNLQGKTGYYIRVSDQAFVYQISQQDWQLFMLNIYSFQTRSAFKNRPHDAFVFERNHLNKNQLKQLHTFLLTEQAQSLSLTRPQFKAIYPFNIGLQKAELMLEGDKIVMHWVDSPLYYFYQNSEIGQMLRK